MKKFVFASICAAAFLLTGAGLFAQSFSVVTYDDQSAQKGTSEITKTEAQEVINGKTVTTWTFEGKVTTKYQYGYAGVAFIPDEETKAALAAGKGVTFKVVGDGKYYRFRADTPGGADNHYGKAFKTTKDKEITVTMEYKALSQASGWGEIKTFKAGEIFQLAIQTESQPIKSFKFKIYDIEVIK
jgi:putative intracellular protease/amidase